MSHNSQLFKVPIFKEGLRRQKESLRAFRQMSKAAIRRYVESTAFDPAELAEAVRGAACLRHEK